MTPELKKLLEDVYQFLDEVDDELLPVTIQLGEGDEELISENELEDVRLQLREKIRKALVDYETKGGG